MDQLQTNLYQLPTRHWSELRRYIQQWAQVYYLAFRDYRPYKYVTEPIANMPSTDYPYYILILHRHKSLSLDDPDAQTQALLWIHKDSKFLRST